MPHGIKQVSQLLTLNLLPAERCSKPLIFPRQILNYRTHIQTPITSVKRVPLSHVCTNAHLQDVMTPKRNFLLVCAHACT